MDVLECNADFKHDTSLFWFKEAVPTTSIPTCIEEEGFFLYLYNNKRQKVKKNKNLVANMVLYQAPLWSPQKALDNTH